MSRVDNVTMTTWSMQSAAGGQVQVAGKADDPRWIGAARMSSDQTFASAHVEVQRSNSARALSYP